MKTLPANVVLEKNRRDTPFAWLALLDIDLTNGNSYHIVRNHEDVSFLDSDYTAASCVAHYKLNDDEASSTDVEDAAGNYDGTLNGVADTATASVDGLVSKAFTFAGYGSGDYVDCGAITEVLSGTKSISVWYKAADLDDTVYLVCNIDTGYTSDPPGYFIAVSSAGAIVIGWGDSGGDQIGTAAGRVVIGEWVHIVATFTGATGQIYVNGTLRASGDIGTETAETNKTRISGRWTGADSGSTYEASGVIDNVAIFNRALTAADVTILYNAKSDYDAAECVAHWKLDDYAADTDVLDSSGNSNDGTLIGGKNTNAVNVSGKVSDAFILDGSVDYVNCGNILPNGTNDFSISVWFKTTNSDSLTYSESGLVTRKDTTSGDHDGYTLSAPSGRVYFRLADGADHEDCISPLGYNDGQWHHAVAVADRGTDMRVYVDGDLVQTTPETTLGDIEWSGGPLYLGNTPGSAHHFDGTIDNVMMFERALTTDDIDFLYNSGNGTELMPNAYPVGTELVPVVYTAFPFDVETISHDTSGEVTSVVIRVSNVTRFLESDVQSLNGGCGSTVTLTIANSGIITEDYSELQMTFEIISCQVTEQWIDFEVGLPSILQERFPLMRFLGLTCIHKYTGGTAGSPYVECGYVGALTTCDKTLDDCKTHGNEARFGGVLGFRRGTVRLI